MRAPNTYKRDAARVNSITGRSANVSRERLDIEQFLEQRGPQTSTAQQVASGLMVDLLPTRRALQRVAADGMALNVGKDGAFALYVWHTHVDAWRAKAQAQQGQPSAAPSEPPVRNSNQPNGSQAYWREHIRQMMTPARAGLMST
jgi:hypothetical protein